MKRLGLLLYSISLSTCLVTHSSVMERVRSLQETLQQEAKFCGERFYAFISSFQDISYQFKIYGDQPVDPEIQLLVDEVCAKFGLDSTLIPCHYAKPALKARAFSTTKAIYLDKEWFASLNAWQQRFIVGHEVAHIAKQHHKQHHLFDLATAVGMTGLLATKRVKFSASRLFGLVCGHQLMSYAYGRSQEKEADILSAQTLGLALNPSVLKNLQETNQPTIWKWLSSWFAEHPSALEQAEYLVASNK